MRILLITKIFPNALNPGQAPFNRRQFAALSRYCDIDVFATIPWFPGASRFSRWNVSNEAPREEVIDGLPVRHPRFLYLPKVAPFLNGPLYAASMLFELARHHPAPDVVVGSFAYPDGFAAVCLAELLGVPSVIKVHGSDIDVLSRQPAVRSALQWGLKRATRIVAVSKQLADGVHALGVPRDRIDVVMNGVDRSVFRPRDRGEARAALGRPADRRTLLYVGHLLRDKGALDAIAAFERIAPAHPDLDLVLVGHGADAQACHAAAERLGGRVLVTGQLPHAEVARWVAACDALVLPSHHEGTPNVVLEALASGRRVVATRVGGIPDVLTSPELGELVTPGDLPELAEAMRRAAYAAYDPEQVSALAGCTGWDESALALYNSILAARGEHPVPMVEKAPILRHVDGLPPQQVDGLPPRWAPPHASWRFPDRPQGDLNHARA
ncbi:glycosyl transferase [Sorangium cellulosum]|uniref:Glycosyl transferase n=1 Tax=Sorangium cellulosum TaxID=56 RepID=A0A2L0EL59_SORCE|nr:glycosyltransferase family 4 protein [Sorangium cellulosum]AUX40025.1 glycosyl transferase [Sorangium cellulosum]